MFPPSTKLLCPTCATAVGSSDNISFSRKTWHKACFRCKTCQTPLNEDNVAMRYDDDDYALYCKRHSIIDSVSNSMLSSRQSQRHLSNGDSLLKWSVDDVIVWLQDNSLEAYGENFRKNEIDGSVLMDETDGVNENTIKQLIPSIGAQLKFKKALRTLRNHTNTTAVLSNKVKEIKQKPEAPLQLLRTIQQQTQQMTTITETINYQAKEIEEFLARLLANKRSPRVNAFNQLSSTVQNQLLDLPLNTPYIPIVAPGSAYSCIPAVDSVAPSLLALLKNSGLPITITPVATATDGPKGASGVSFPAVIHPDRNGIAIKPVLDDIYNIQNYGKYSVTIYDENSENILVETLVNVVPEHEICMPKKFVLRDSVNNILVGATVQIKLGDQIIFSGRTDKTGTVEIPSTLPKNCYDVEINSGDSKYKPSVFRMIVYENRGADVNTQFICRQLQSDQLEIVLKWALLPSDLDSHVFVSDGRHVYFRSKCQGKVSLDCDVTNGNGPETIKITLEPNLKYLYVVHRYTGDGLLTESCATVTFNNGEIIQSSKPFQTVQIPVVNQPRANFWIVCEIDGTTRKIDMFENTFENHNNFATDEIPRKYLKK